MDIITVKNMEETHITTSDIVVVDTFESKQRVKIMFSQNAISFTGYNSIMLGLSCKLGALLYMVSRQIKMQNHIFIKTYLPHFKNTDPYIWNRSTNYFGWRQFHSRI